MLRTYLLKAVLLPFLLALGLVTQVAAAEKVKLAYSVWIGYGPLFVAQEKGYFDQEGLDVELVLIEDAKLRFAALAASRIDLLATTVDTMPLYLKDSQQYRYVFGLDESVGADGILFKNEIKSIADLRGKTVAYGKGSVMEFYLGALLADAGMSLDDVKGVNMTAGDAGSAFVTKQIDAAVTWEPYLYKGDQTEHGYKFTDTKQSPGLLADVVIAKAGYANNSKKTIAALYRAWVKAVDFSQNNPAEANKIMGKGLGGWLKKPEVIADVLTGVTFMSAARNKAYMGSETQPGEIVSVIEKSLSFLKGKVQVDVNAAELVSHAAFECC